MKGTKDQKLQEYQEMVTDCEDRESLLSEWETTFIESAGEQIAEKEFITIKQVAILERLWEKVTEAG